MNVKNSLHPFLTCLTEIKMCARDLSSVDGTIYMESYLKLSDKERLLINNIFDSTIEKFKKA